MQAATQGLQEGHQGCLGVACPADLASRVADPVVLLQAEGDHIPAVGLRTLAAVHRNLVAASHSPVVGHHTVAGWVPQAAGRMVEVHRRGRGLLRGRQGFREVASLLGKERE